MRLLISQKNELADIIESFGADFEVFSLVESDIDGTCIHVKNNSELLFNFRETIQGAEFCDIYYRPTNKQPYNHLYVSVNSFEEAIPYFLEWLDCLSLELNIVDKLSKK